MSGPADDSRVDDFNRMAQYLEGGLSPEERAAFEAEMGSSAELVEWLAEADRIRADAEDESPARRVSGRMTVGRRAVLTVGAGVLAAAASLALWLLPPPSGLDALDDFVRSSGMAASSGARVSALVPGVRGTGSFDLGRTSFRAGLMWGSLLVESASASPTEKATEWTGRLQAELAPVPLSGDVARTLTDFGESERLDYGRVRALGEELSVLLDEELFALAAWSAVLLEFTASGAAPAEDAQSFFEDQVRSAWPQDLVGPIDDVRLALASGDAEALRVSLEALVVRGAN